MNEQLSATAQTCLDGAYSGAMDFPSIVGTLSAAGFDGYDVDYQQGTSTYFLATGESVQLSLPKSDTKVAEAFRASELELAVQEAQSNAPGYTYVGFCAKVKAAGCAGYKVSFSGKRVVYFGLNGETHVEHFPA